MKRVWGVEKLLKVYELVVYVQFEWLAIFTIHLYEDLKKFNCHRHHHLRRRFYHLLKRERVHQSTWRATGRRNRRRPTRATLKFSCSRILVIQVTMRVLLTCVVVAALYSYSMLIYIKCYNNYIHFDNGWEFIYVYFRAHLSILHCNLKNKFRITFLSI